MRKPARILIAGLASLMAVAGFMIVGYSFIYHPVAKAPQAAVASSSVSNTVVGG